MKLEQLKSAASSLAASSDFRYGDPTSFKVVLLPHEVELPGPSDPEKYLDLLRRKLKLEVVKGASVAVVCPGNGGLVAEALLVGAKEVVAIEPRPRFAGAIERVCGILRGIYGGQAATTYRSWPGSKATIGPFDLVLWSEGLEECRDPLAVLDALSGLLRAEPKGALCVEVTHGGHTRTTPPLNAFRPAPAVWQDVLASVGGEITQTPGRAGGRVIYRVGGAAAALPKPEAKKPEVKKPEVKKPAPKATPKPAPKAKKPEPKPKPKVEKAPKPEPKAEKAPEPETEKTPEKATEAPSLLESRPRSGLTKPETTPQPEKPTADAGE